MAADTLNHTAMSRHAKTQALLESAVASLTVNHPMTVRQVYYQLVSTKVIENNRSQYQAVSNLLVEARQSGEIPWDWIEDRLRQPRRVSMWADLAAFARTARVALHLGAARRPDLPLLQLERNQRTLFINHSFPDSEPPVGIGVVA